MRVLQLDGATVANLYIDENPLEDLPTHLKHYNWACKRTSKDKKAAQQRTTQRAGGRDRKRPQGARGPAPFHYSGFQQPYPFKAPALPYGPMAPAAPPAPPGRPWLSPPGGSHSNKK